MNPLASEKYSACFIVPNYNHAVKFQQVIDELCQFELAIIVVNDGSNQTTRQVLQKIAEQVALVELIHLEKNQGKGGAVMAGMRHAFSLNFTHAFQIDADGQHNLSDIKQFLKNSQTSPNALICGYPIYDQSVPKSRLIPRYITHFWVWVETLSFNIKDSMCGFRVYPLAQTMELLDQSHLGKRMDFDIEILVKLYWQSVYIEFLPTKVIYPEDGVSHFNLLHDNWLISKMHTKLFFGMLPRIVKLNKVRRQYKQAKQALHWGSSKEKGTSFGINFLVNTYKLLGRNVFLFFLHPVIAYFVATSSTARHSSRVYLQQLAKYQGKNTSVSWFKIYQHFYQFGVCAIDKIGCWLGKIKSSDVISHGSEHIEYLAKNKQGAVFIGSHLGNIELSRAIAEQDNQLKINAVVFNKNALKFQQVLKKTNPNVELNLIHVEHVGVETAFLLESKVKQGEIIIIVGDRTSISSAGRVRYVNFLGKPAPFNEGPFIMAGLLECPVYLLNCIKQQGKYNIYLEHFADSLKFQRQFKEEKLGEMMQRYADRLTHYCQLAPLQWFNFYDFWQVDNEKNIKRIKTTETNTELK